MKLRVLIVDDERLARQKLRRFLDTRPEKMEISEAKNGLEALERVPTFKPQLVLLDVQMPGLSGFEFLGQLEERDFKIIFQTAYDEFALKAFEENACDYLLKPFDEPRFHQAFDRALASLQQASRLENLEAQLARRDKYLRKFAVKQGAQWKLIAESEVTCFVSRDHYTCLYAGAKEYIFEGSLNHLEPRLDPSLFLRIHRNSIIRKSAIRTVKSGDNMSLTLANDLTLGVSRRHRGHVFQEVQISV